MNPELANLVKRESILGKIKAGSEGGSIHCGDFNQAVNELGFTLADHEVGECLADSILDLSGFINYKPLEISLRRLRTNYNNNNTKGRPSKPYSMYDAPSRQDFSQIAAVEAEERKRIIQENNQVIQQYFLLYLERKIDERGFLSFLRSLGIGLTSGFLHTIRKNRSSMNLSFQEFYLALVCKDKDMNHADDSTSGLNAAGYYQEKGSDKWCFKRKNNAYMDAHKFGQISDMYTANYDVAQGPAYRQSNDSYSSRNLKSAFDLSDGITKHNIHTSVAQSSGFSGLNDGQNLEDVEYTIVARTWREYLLACMRRIRYHKTTLEEFMQKMFMYNIDLPDTLISMLKKHQKSGYFDWPRVVSTVDDWCRRFVVQASQSSASKYINALDLKEKFISILKNHGSIDFITEMVKCFIEMDTSGDGLISFTEFHSGCKMMFSEQEMLDYDALVVLFNSLDSSGDGQIELMEFLSKLRGDLTPRRVGIIRMIFDSLDEFALGKVSVQRVISRFVVSKHPDVLQGRISEKEARQRFVFVMKHLMDETGQISFLPFMNIFGNISHSIANHEEFERIMREMWNIPELLPPPPTIAAHSSLNGNRHPMALQTYGNITAWNQKESQMEKIQNSRRKEGLRTTGADINQSVHSCNINVFKHGGNMNAEDQKMIEREWEGVGGRANAHKADANWNTTDGLLEWKGGNTDRPAPVTKSLGHTINNNTYNHPTNRFKGDIGKGVTLDYEMHRRINHQKATKNFHNSCPFGKDAASVFDLSMRTQPIKKQQSLASILKTQ